MGVADGVDVGVLLLVGCVVSVVVGTLVGDVGSGEVAVGVGVVLVALGSDVVAGELLVGAGLVVVGLVVVGTEVGGTGIGVHRRQGRHRRLTTVSAPFADVVRVIRVAAELWEILPKGIPSSAVATPAAAPIRPSASALETNRRRPRRRATPATTRWTGAASGWRCFALLASGTVAPGSLRYQRYQRLIAGWRRRGTLVIFVIGHKCLTGISPTRFGNMTLT